MSAGANPVTDVRERIAYLVVIQRRSPQPVHQAGWHRCTGTQTVVASSQSGCCRTCGCFVGSARTVVPCSSSIEGVYSDLKLSEAPTHRSGRTLISAASAFAEVAGTCATYEPSPRGFPSER